MRLISKIKDLWLNHKHINSFTCDVTFREGRRVWKRDLKVGEHLTICMDCMQEINKELFSRVGEKSGNL